MKTATFITGLALVGSLALPAGGQLAQAGRRVPPDVSLAGIEGSSSQAWPAPTGLITTTGGDDIIVQSGEITELGEVEILLDPFDDQGGTRRLDFVQIDLFSSIFGGFTRSGVGGSVHVSATYDQDYFLGNSFLAGTHVVFRDTLPNDSLTAFSFFLSDTDQRFIVQPRKLEPWIGTDPIVLTSIGTLTWLVQPPEGLLDFGAGLTGTYTVTYHFSEVDCRTDLNGDGLVNVLDLRTVVAAFGNPGGPEDINEDGIVNARDLRLVVAAFGACP